MTTEIPKEQWKEFFDNLSRDLDGWETRVEILNNNVGSQVLSEGLPFHGLTAESDAAGEFVLELSVGEATHGHQTHTIQTPFKVSFEEPGIGRNTSLDIEDAAGNKMFVRFVPPFPVPVDYTETEIISVAAAID
jgi:hypothetical protein